MRGTLPCEMKPLLSDLNLASDASAAINLLALTPQAWREIANACETTGEGTGRKCQRRQMSPTRLISSDTISEVISQLWRNCGWGWGWGGCPRRPSWAVMRGGHKLSRNDSASGKAPGSRRDVRCGGGDQTERRPLIRHHVPGS